MKADLHMHSKSSDGVKTIEELFILAKERNVDIISITDHDVVKDMDFAFECSKKYGVRFIPGIELSTLEQGKPVHVLGYFQDESYNSESMMKYYNMIKTGRENRTKKFISNLKEHFDIEITYDEVLSYSNGIIARPHIAKAIVNNYKQYSFDYVFEEFIGDNSKAFVPSTKLSVKEGIDLLKKNNCIVSLAHPTLLKETIKDVVLSQKFDCLEAIYYRNKENDEDYFREFCLKRNMVITAGSDYHGIENDTKHGTLGEITLQGKDLEKFLEIYNPKFV